LEVWRSAWFPFGLKRGAVAGCQRCAVGVRKKLFHVRRVQARSEVSGFRLDAA